MQWSPECFCRRCRQCPHICNKTICAWAGAPHEGCSSTVDFRKSEYLGEFPESGLNICHKIYESEYNESIKKKREINRASASSSVNIVNSMQASEMCESNECNF